MKVIAINGSPKDKNSATYRMLSELTTGMQKAGAETEIVNLSELEIKHCRGCLACWFETPGKCIIKDDMAPLLEKLVTNDLIIYGTPLYSFSMTGLFKNFLDRCLPLIEPWMIESKKIPGATTLQSRYKKPNKMLLVSNCGFPEMQNFEPLVANFRKLTAQGDAEYLGEILFAAGGTLLVEELQEKLLPYYRLLQEAGKQIVEQGKISDELKPKLQQSIFPGSSKEYREMANEEFKKRLGVQEKAK